MTKKDEDIIRRIIREELRMLMQSPPQDYVGIKEAAEIVGWSVGYMRNMIYCIPHEKVNGRLRFKPYVLREWVRQVENGEITIN